MKPWNKEKAFEWCDRVVIERCIDVWERMRELQIENPEFRFVEWKMNRERFIEFLSDVCQCPDEEVDEAIEMIERQSLLEAFE